MSVELPVEPSVKVSVIYYSATGVTHQIAQELADTAEKAGAEVRLRRVREIAPQAAIDANPAWTRHVAAAQDVSVADPADIDWADAVILGSPTRFGNTTSQFQQFIDTLGGLWGQGQLADKVYSGFTASSTAHGGQETTLQALYTSIHHFGGIVVAPGYTDSAKFADGNPYGTSYVTGDTSGIDGVTRAAAQVQAQRVVRITTALVAGVALQQR